MKLILQVFYGKSEMGHEIVNVLSSEYFSEHDPILNTFVSNIRYFSYMGVYLEQCFFPLTILALGAM